MQEKTREKNRYFSVSETFKIPWIEPTWWHTEVAQLYDNWRRREERENLFVDEVEKEHSDTKSHLHITHYSRIERSLNEDKLMCVLFTRGIEI